MSKKANNEEWTKIYLVKANLAEPKTGTKLLRRWYTATELELKSGNTRLFEIAEDRELCVFQHSFGGAGRAGLVYEYERNGDSFRLKRKLPVGMLRDEETASEWQAADYALREARKQKTAAKKIGDPNWLEDLDGISQAYRLASTLNEKNALLLRAIKRIQTGK